MEDFGTGTAAVGGSVWPYVVSFAGAIILLVVGVVLIKWVSKMLPGALMRFEWMDDTLRPVFAAAIGYTLYVFLGIMVLAQFGIQTASLIAVLGAAGLAIGLALQGTLSNIAAGMMLLILRPIRVGEYIDAEGLAGTVLEIGLFTTELKTFDGVYRSVPNSNIWNRSILNYSRNPTRRIDVAIGIAYEDDLEKAMAVLLDLLKSDPRILTDAPAETMINALADSSVNVNMRCWVDKDDYWAVFFFLHREGKKALEVNGFTIPFPQRTVHISADKAGAPAAPTAARKAPARRRTTAAAKKG
ncbi:mechanosensitive ion channel family protein [Thiohalomonas denitrificans]|uniref:mechanosensitive ion channel family protein n=1 Tax=Thiohalomonas denitrificans TaxID=415747 RepID=UPI0026EE988C|nr:mechanosensitive ion channel domain-containing protein [Thiohalomonas denitrificans]